MFKIIVLFLLSVSTFASNVSVSDIKINEELTALFKENHKTKDALLNLKTKTLVHHTKAVPVLISVMKENQYPEANRWIATFLLGQIMGEKSAPFIAKFVAHPHWMMRLASLKTLLILKQKKYLSHYAHALKDKSLLVRHQALENINKLKIKELSPHVWNMLYDKENYSGKEGKLKRAEIIKNVIHTLGDLEFKDVQKPMSAMLKNKKFKDLHGDLAYSLTKITGKKVTY